MPARHVAIGKPKHQGEKRGIDLVVRCLPDGYVVYSNVELSTGRRSGTTYEHDLLVLAPHAVFTVELKSWGGRLTGNRDRWQRESGAIVQSPIPLTLEKARVLKGVLETRARALRDVWVQGLVLLTEVDAQPVITPDFAHFVTTRRDIQRALTDPAAWGLTGNQLTKAQREDILRVFSDGEPATIPSTLGHFELLQRLTAEGRPYTAWLGKGPLGEQRVLHHYEIRGDSEKNRDRRRDLPLREATLHERLKGGPDLLDYCGYIPIEDPEGFVLTFEDTTPLLPAGTWVDKHNPGLEDRLRVARRVADALAWMHRRDVVHRRLSVDAILVSPAPSPAVVRLSALELSRDLAGLAPSVPSSLLEDPSYRCMAPELIRGGEATPASDLFSLGATLVELLSGRPLFERIEDALREFEIPPLHVGGQPVTVEVSLIIRDLLAPQPNERPVDAADVAERLGEVLRRAGRPAPRPDREILREGQRVLDVYELVKHLGEGASGSTWKARHTVDGSMVVLKIADAAQAPMLTNEADVLQQVHHANLVRYRDLRPFGGGSVLILACADGVDGRTWAGAGDALSLAQLLHLAGGLFGALGALHDAGWIHRDVKPENLVLRERDAQATLIDLGFARRAGEEGELTVGTVAYKDPLLWKQNGWTAGHDLFAAWLVIYEVLTGVHPFNARPESGRAPAIDPTLFPEAFEEAARRLAALFEAALSPDPGKRPATAADALARMRDALRASPPSAAPDRPRPAKSHNLPLPMPEPPRRIVLPDAVTPDTRIEQIDISSRALSALERLGARVVSQLGAVDPAQLAGLRNVGRKTRAEILKLREAVRARFPTPAPAPPRGAAPATELVYPALIGNDDPLGELGHALPDALRDALHTQGVTTVGGLAALPVTALRAHRVAAGRLGDLRKALRQLAGEADRPASLKELGAALKEEIRADFPILVLLLGLAGEEPLSSQDAADRLKFTRQRISQAKDVEPLRAGASAAAWLVSTVEEVLPRAGFAPLSDVAHALAARLPEGEGASAVGYARLAAVLLEPARRVSDAGRIDLVARAPWTRERIDAQRDRLSAAATWPPLARDQAEALLWDALDPELAGALRRWGADAGALLRATLPLCPGIARTPDDSLLTPPVPFAAALKEYRPKLTPGIGLEALQEALRREYTAVEDPAEPRAVLAALAAEGLTLREGLVVEVGAELDRAPREPALDPDVPRQRVAPDAPIPVRGLMVALDQGGFRVVGLAAGQHHKLCEQLAASLREAIGEDRVRFVDVDRALIEALQSGGLWDDAVFEDGRPSPRWGWATKALEAGLEAAVIGQTSGIPAARPGVVTVLGRPALLGPLGLMAWLSGFYERARGGRYGLVVLAVPGDVHDARVRLNEQYSLPYTPDMAAVWVERVEAAA